MKKKNQVATCDLFHYSKCRATASLPPDHSSKSGCCLLYSLYRIQLFNHVSLEPFFFKKNSNGLICTSFPRYGVLLTQKTYECFLDATYFVIPKHGGTGRINVYKYQRILHFLSTLFTRNDVSKTHSSSVSVKRISR
jgi:hypothetical protein